MAKTATVRARIEPELKQHAESILENLGVKPSEAINLLYHQIKQTGTLPFAMNDNKAIAELGEDMQRLEACRAGDAVEHASVDAWLKSIGSDDELPCPVK
jgi:DNA-damage-inducible protein J